MKVIDANPWILDHIKLYQTDPEAAHMWDATVTGGPGPTPSLLLTTTGRNSGEPRHAPLIYQEVDGNYVVLASKGGMDTHPVWYLNLEANPQCHVQVSTRSTKAVAHTARGAEREALWEIMIKFYPLYVEYQGRTEREIPIVVLAPTD